MLDVVISVIGIVVVVVGFIWAFWFENKAQDESQTEEVGEE